MERRAGVGRPQGPPGTPQAAHGALTASLEAKIHAIRQRAGNVPPPSYTEPVRSPERDDLPQTTEGAVALLREHLGARVVATYLHHPDGYVVDAQTKERLDKIPRG